MLYRPIIGTEPSSHPEIQAFIKGLRLSCPNGFDFINVRTILFALAFFSSLIAGYLGLEIF